MNFSVKELFSSDPKGFAICLHPDHKAVLEILSMKEYQKALEKEGGYVLLELAETKDQALARVGDMLLEVYQKDPLMQNIKQSIAEAGGLV